MPIVLQNRFQPSEMLITLASLANRQITNLRVAVAYTTYAGCDLLLPTLANRIGLGWQVLPKTIVTSLDFGHTEPQALRYLRDTPGCTVLVSGVEVLRRAHLMPEVCFHPKVYVFDESARQTAFVGSANLTLKALTINTEVARVEETATSDPLVEHMWSALVQDSTPLTSSLLTEYQLMRSRMVRRVSRPAVEPDVLPHPVTLPHPNSIVAFWEALAAGQLHPNTFDRFWVEAGSMSSGGSANQLELPRGANRFFGFSFDNYGESHERIGYPTLTASGLQWSDRVLTWHGNNGMERINLPTRTRGGFMYANTAILFRRRDGNFELVVAPWESPLAISWREASVSVNRLYRLGGPSNRICGFF